MHCGVTLTGWAIKGNQRQYEKPNRKKRQRSRPKKSWNEIGEATTTTIELNLELDKRRNKGQGEMKTKDKKY